MVQILLQLHLRDILELASVEWVLPDMGARLDTRKENQATQEPSEVNLHRGGSFSWLSVPNTILLVGSLLGHTIPYLRQSSFVSLRKKFGRKGSLSISLVFCRISLAAGWYCNLNSHPPEDTVATQWHKRILSNFSLELKIKHLPFIKDVSYGHLS